MDIDKLTIGEAREIARLVGGGAATPTSAPTCLTRLIGSNVLVQTVTLYYLGRVVAVDGFGITLANASWIPDLGRFHVAMEKGIVNECEPFPGDGATIVGLGAIVNVAPWVAGLPRAAK